MKVPGVHPSAFMYNENCLRLEPLGPELVSEALRRGGHDVRLLDLQGESELSIRRGSTGRQLKDR